MRERLVFDPFVYPFLIGMAFVLLYCLGGLLRVFFQLPRADRLRFLRSLVTPKTAWKNVKDIFLNCLIHVKLWKRNRLLGFMHSSIAFGWFMLILLGHIEVLLYVPGRANLLYYPIFFNYFVAETETTLKGTALLFLMDFFLLLILIGISLAVIKRVRSRIFGMRRTTRPAILDRVGLYSLWAIFPLRLLAESTTAHISGGSFLTGPMNWLYLQLFGSEIAVQPVWWAYSIALCIFMLVLPFTRYMHIPAEMLLIPLRNAGIKIRHPRKGFALAEVYSCPGCGVCIDACPMSARKENIKDSTVYLNRQIRRGNERRIAEISDKCLLCGKCTAVCQVGVQGPELRIAQRSLRHYYIKPDFAPFDTEPWKERLERERGKVLYFAGCMTHLTPSIRKSLTSVLSKAGVQFKVMDPDGGICCGRPLQMAGRLAEAKALIAKNREIILGSGCDTLLVSCPICYRVFKEKYHLSGIRVVHHSVFLNELLQSGRLHVQKGEETLVYHDPCELGRGCGIYEEPRHLLSSAGKLVEAAKNRSESICCGGSVGSLSLGFEKRKDITKASLQNLTAASPDRIVTACPLCQSTYSRYSDRPVEDLATIIDRQS